LFFSNLNSRFTNVNALLILLQMLSYKYLQRLPVYLPPMNNGLCYCNNKVFIYQLINSLVIVNLVTHQQVIE